jgi:tight adherence protein B
VDREFYALLSGAGSELSAGTALALVAGAGVVGAVPALLAWENLLLAVAGALVGFALPLLWWMFLRWSRLRNMQRNLPQALDLLADSLASGQTLEQSAEMVAMQAVPPLREEFAHCVTLLRMGQSPLAVMERMSRRIPLPEFKLFSTAVLVHQQTGGDLAKLTARLANSARDRQEFLRHLGGQTVAGRYSALGLVACGVLGTLALIATRPQYMEFFIDHPAGISLLLTSAALVLVGSFWISRILKIAY